MALFKNSLCLLTVLIILTSCKNKSQSDTPSNPKLNVNVSDIEKDFMGWWIYQNNDIDLSSDFVASNEKGEEIEKEKFFQKMRTGEYIPVKLVDHGKNNTYQLQELGENADQKIRQEIKRLSVEHFKNFRKIGTEFPDFSFNDIEGNHFSKKGLKGKTIIFKTWFINCKPCIEEFPELNDLVQRFATNEDVVFISLALDSQTELTKFLSTKPFEYIVIPDQQLFIKDELQTNKFPTHIIVDKNGNYERIPDNAKKLIAYLEGSDIKKPIESKMPPPPPSN